jgi:hypothetical protein
LIETTPPDRPVRLSRFLLMWGLLIGMLLAWPLLLLGRPAYISDSAAYYKGGRVAVGFAVEHVAPATNQIEQPTAPRSGAQLDGSAAAAQARGARSISYSVVAYLLGAPRAQLVLLVLAQALLTGLVSVIVLDFFAPTSRKRRLATAAVLAFATPVAFVACLALPDIFTGLLVIAIILPAVGESRLSLAAKLFLAAVGIFGVTAHSSHPPLAAGLTLIITIWLIISWRRGDHSAPRAWAWAAAPVILGLALTVGANRVGFGDASVAAKRFPLTLARSVADGPGRWYLEKHCAIEHFAICEVFPHGFPHDVNAFLWGRTGIDERASPKQLDRIRAEEVAVVAAATREYLGIELLHLSTSFVRQLVKIRPEATFDQRVQLDQQKVPRVVPASGLTPTTGLLIQWTSLLAAAVSLVWIWQRHRSLAASERLAVMLTIAALLINAAICVYFSGVAHRYQARVVWLIPLLALALAGTGDGQIIGTTAQPKPSRD